MAAIDPKTGFETSEFPILCETCLGDNPYIRMTKQSHGKECKVCTRPFTVFRWCPGKGMRFKKTEICQTCSKLKNVCQTCLLDLEFGLPTQVRDTAMKIGESVPTSDYNREYHANQMDLQLANGNVPDYAEASAAAREMLKKVARTEPFYKRNQAHICSFFVKGECKRGSECPYRHEMPPEKSELSDQNIKDRYHGTNDPVAKKIMARMNGLPRIVPPEDKMITTLFIGNVDDGINEHDLRAYFYAYGELTSVNVVPKNKCAFITYARRQDAETAAEKTYDNLLIKGKQLRVAWGRPKVLGSRAEIAAERGSGDTMGYGGSYHSVPFPSHMPPPLPAGVTPPPPPPSSSGSIPPPPGSGPRLYPSMDPSHYGSAGPRTQSLASERN